MVLVIALSTTRIFTGADDITSSTARCAQAVIAAIQSPSPVSAAWSSGPAWSTSASRA